MQELGGLTKAQNVVHFAHLKKMYFIIYNFSIRHECS